MVGMESFKLEINQRPNLSMQRKSSPPESIDIGPLIHQAALTPHLSLKSLNTFCDAARHFKFSGLCTSLNYLPAARERLGASCTTKLIAVIAFPFGTIPSLFKEEEGLWAIDKGAEELEIVPNFLALSQGKSEIYAEELARICELGLPVRVILDMANLPPNQLNIAINAAIEAGVCGLQSGNGFGPAVDASQICRLKELARGRCEIKAVGGLKTLDQAKQLIQAGATKLGTSSGPELMRTFRQEQA